VVARDHAERRGRAAARIVAVRRGAVHGIGGRCDRRDRGRRRVPDRGGSGSNPTAAPAAVGALSVVLTASPIDAATQLGPAMDRSLTILHARLGSVVPGVRVSRAGNEIVVTTPNRNAGARARILALIGTTAQLALYDWEANVIAPDGKTVAGQLKDQNPTATEISQWSAKVTRAPDA
jgi:hypothetical protein